MIEDEEIRMLVLGIIGVIGLGIMLDLIGKNIFVLFDEVVDILRIGVERFVLLYNVLKGFLLRFL